MAQTYPGRARPVLGPQPEPLLLVPEEAAAMLRVSRATMYELISSGEIETIKLGSSRRVLRSGLVAFIERQLTEQLGERQPLSERPVTEQRRERQAIERQAAGQPGGVPADAGARHGSA